MKKLTIENKQTILAAAQLIIEANKLLLSNNDIFVSCADETKQLRNVINELVKKIN